MAWRFPLRLSVEPLLRPRVLSRTFLGMAAMAAVVSPRRAFAALAQLAKGRRLRAWNLLNAVAADSENYYAHWTRIAEPVAFARWFERSREVASHGNIVLLTWGNTDAAACATALGECVYAIDLPDGGSLLDTFEAIDRTHPGAWILPLADPDRLSSRLGEILPRITRSDADLVFWDEDLLVAGRRCDPWFKPQFDPLLFATQDGLTGAAIVRLDALLAAARKQPGLASTPANLSEALRSVAARSSEHVPLVLTHRTVPIRLGIAPQPDVPQPWPEVTIIVPTRDHPELLRGCLQGIAALDYPGKVQTLVVDNGTTDPQALALLDEWDKRQDVTVLPMPGPFNFSKLNNAAVTAARGEIVCLLNNDIEPIDGQWLSNMVRHAVAEDAGAVGAMLLYPDGTIQHAGVAIGIGDAAGHVQKDVFPEDSRYRHWMAATRQVSAVTAACLVVAREKYLAVGGLDAQAFPVAFNDVDFCLKLAKAGWRNRYVAEARLIHYESKSRGLDLDPEKRERFARELSALQARWGTASFDDPHYSPAFARSSERCVLQFYWQAAR